MWIYQHRSTFVLAPRVLCTSTFTIASEVVAEYLCSWWPSHRCTHPSPAMLPGDSLEWTLIAAEVRVCEKKSRHLQVVRQVFKTTPLEAPRRSTFSRFFRGYHSAFSHWSLQCFFSRLCLPRLLFRKDVSTSQGSPKWLAPIMLSVDESNSFVCGSRNPLETIDGIVDDCRIRAEFWDEHP